MREFAVTASMRGKNVGSAKAHARVDGPILSCSIRTVSVAAPASGPSRVVAFAAEIELPRRVTPRRFSPVDSGGTSADGRSCEVSREGQGSGDCMRTVAVPRPLRCRIRPIRTATGPIRVVRLRRGPGERVQAQETRPTISPRSIRAKRKCRPPSGGTRSLQHGKGGAGRPGRPVRLTVLDRR